MSLISNNKSDLSKDYSNIQNLKQKIDLNNINYSDKEETTISFKNEISSQNMNNQTINVSNSNLDFNPKCNFKLKSYLKNISTEPNKSNYEINYNNNSGSNCNLANLNNMNNHNIVTNNNYLLSLPNNPSNINKSSTQIINQDHLNIHNNKLIEKTNLNKFKYSAISIKSITGKTNKNNSCNYTGSNNNNNKKYKNKNKKNLNFSNNSINNNNNSIINNSRKILTTSNNTSLKNEIGGSLNYNNHVNNNIQTKGNNDSISLMISSILSNSKNKTASNFFDETKIPNQSNVSYSFKSEVIKIKPIKTNKLNGSGVTVHRKIDNIINENITKIRSQLDNLDYLLNEFKLDTEFIKKNF